MNRKLLSLLNESLPFYNYLGISIELGQVEKYPQHYEETNFLFTFPSHLMFM